MRFGVSFGPYLPGASAEPADWVQLAQAAERLGFDSIWTGDHIVLPASIDQGPHERDVGGVHAWNADANLFEPLTTLSFLAGHVSTVKLGLGVLIVPYRNPVLAAKMLATLDVLSAGRLIVGVGSGWMREEFQALAVREYSERGAVTDEYLRLFVELWTKTRPEFEGTYYSISGVGFEPKPVQKPHPPVWIGGNGGTAMRRAARFGTGWFPVYQTPQEMAEKIPTLHRLATDAARKPDDISVVVGLRFGIKDTDVSEAAETPLVGSTRQMREAVLRFEDAGVDELHLHTGEWHTSPRKLMDEWERFAGEVSARL